jgi:hypothetical protein
MTRLRGGRVGEETSAAIAEPSTPFDGGVALTGIEIDEGRKAGPTSMPSKPVLAAPCLGEPG